MAQAAHVLTYVHVVLMAVLLAGLAHTRLYRIAYALAAYSAALVLQETLILAWPAFFWTWPFFLIKETVYGILKIVLLLEITDLTYQTFPIALAQVRMLLRGALVATMALLIIGLPTGAEFPDLVRELVRRLANGTALACLSTWSLVLWYRIPLHRFHRALLRGLVPYSVIVATARSLTLTFGWDVRDMVNLADNACYAVMVAYWCWEVWRKPPREPDFLRTLQPWRARL